MKQLCSSGKVNGWSRWWKRTVDLPSDWRAMAREGTRIRERANMTWNRPSNQLETGWERNRNGERGRGDGGGGPEEGVLEERFRRSRFSLGDGITFAVIGGRHECLRP